MRDKVLVIGIDSADLELIKPWAKKGKLPTFERLMKEGSWGKLESTVPFMSAPAWTTAVTGKNPGKHGIFAFTKLPTGSYRAELLDSSHRRAEAIWQMLSRYKKRIGVFNLPIAYPPEKVDGFMVSGFLAPGVESNFTYPRSLKKKLLMAAPGYCIEAEDHRACILGKRDVFARLGLWDIRVKLETAEFLLKEYPNLDCFIIVFRYLDRIQHHLWDVRSVVLRHYQELDRAIDRLITLFGNKARVMIVSDHGMTGLKGMVFLNNALEEAGFLKRKKNFRELAKLVLRKLDLTAERIEVLRFKLNLPESFDYHLGCLQSKLPLASVGLEAVDWGKTLAYTLPGEIGGININLKGREAEGIVPKEESDELKEKIIKKLGEIRDPQDKKRVIVKVHKKGELYHGPWANQAPDLIVEPANGYRCFPGFGKDLFTGLFFYSLPRVGVHKKEGIFIAWGRGIKKDFELKRATILDITPTILKLMNLPIPDDMDGGVLEEIFTHKIKIG